MFEFIINHGTHLFVAVYVLLTIIAPMLPERARTFLNAIVFDADRFSQAALGVRFNLPNAILMIDAVKKADALHADAYEKTQKVLREVQAIVEKLDGKSTQQIPISMPLGLQVPVDTQDAPIVTTTDVTP